MRLCAQTALERAVLGESGKIFEVIKLMLRGIMNSDMVAKKIGMSQRQARRYLRDILFEVVACFKSASDPNEDQERDIAADIAAIRKENQSGREQNGE